MLSMRWHLIKHLRNKMSGRRRDHLLLCYWLQRRHWKSRLLNLKRRQKTWKPEKLRMRTTWLASGTDSGKDIRSVITIALADKSQQLLWRCWIDPTKGITKKGERNGLLAEMVNHASWCKCGCHVLVTATTGMMHEATILRWKLDIFLLCWCIDR